MLPDVLVVSAHNCINSTIDGPGLGLVSRYLQVQCQKMSKTKYLKGACQHCGGHLEFLADYIGMSVTCPHCQQETELQLQRPPDEPIVTHRTLWWTALAVVVLGLGLGAALLALNRAQRWAEQQRHQAAATVSAPTAPQPGPTETNAPPQNELSASSVELEKTPGSSLVYAVGTVKNRSGRPRFGVKVELELTDAAGQKIGTASDYRPVLDPGGEWRFKALVVQPKVVSATISSVREDQ